MSDVKLEGDTTLEFSDWELIINHRAVLGCHQVEKLITKYTQDICAHCFDELRVDSEIICDTCYEKAIEQREKYR